MRSKLSKCNSRTLVRTSCSVLCTRGTIFKGRKMNRSCQNECFATMRLLCLVTLQRLTIISQFISFNLPSFATIIYTLYKPFINIYVSDKYVRFIRDYFGSSCDPNQNLLVARVFCRFWSCASCKSPLDRLVLHVTIFQLYGNQIIYFLHRYSYFP